MGFKTTVNIVNTRRMIGPLCARQLTERTDRIRFKNKNHTYTRHVSDGNALKDLMGRI